MSTTARSKDPFSAKSTFNTGSGTAAIYRLSKLEDAGLGKISALPFSIRLLLEAVLRNCDGYEVTEADVKNLAAWHAEKPAELEIPFKPARVVLQDFTGVPCVVDLAAMRSRDETAGRRSKEDQSASAGRFGDRPLDSSRLFRLDCALDLNVDLEFTRNRERYEFLRWGQTAFNNFRVVPPNIGIVHQVNLEFLAKVAFLRKIDGETVALPDTLVGTDSHTTMINGLGVVGWGVGGIEAEANMLGQPLYMLMPEVIGFEMTGEVQPAVTATDLVLTVTQILRKEGVVGKFVEFFGPGVTKMKLADRATIGNMAPEYGATIGLLPGRCRNVELSALDWPHERRSRSGRALLQRAGLVPYRRARQYSDQVHESAAIGSWHCRTKPGRSEATARSSAAVVDENAVAARSHQYLRQERRR